MNTLKITPLQETAINLAENAWLIVHQESVVGVYEGCDQARKAKKSENIAGKIVNAAKIEFEVVDLAANDEPVSDLPDETISEEDEAELAAQLEAEEAEEVIVLTKRETNNPAPGESAKTLLDAIKKHRGHNEKQIEAAKASKKLNRAVVCVETAQQWDKVGDIHKLNPELMTWSQCGSARVKLYAAAKNGELITVTVAGKNYHLVSVE